MSPTNWKYFLLIRLGLWWQCLFLGYCKSSILGWTHLNAIMHLWSFLYRFNLIGQLDLVPIAHGYFLQRVLFVKGWLLAYLSIYRSCCVYHDLLLYTLFSLHRIFFFALVISLSHQFVSWRLHFILFTVWIGYIIHSFWFAHKWSLDILDR